MTRALERARNIWSGSVRLEPTGFGLGGGQVAWEAGETIFAKALRHEEARAERLEMRAQREAGNDTYSQMAETGTRNWTY